MDSVGIDVSADFEILALARKRENFFLKSRFAREFFVGGVMQISS